MLSPSYLPEAKHTLLNELVEGLEPNALSWLSGYLAGVAEGRQAVRSPISVAAVPAAGPQKRLTIVYGSQTGNAKRVAEALAERTAALGLNTRLVRADSYVIRELKDEHLLYIVISTQGDGEAPDDSRSFVEFLASKRAPKLAQLKYAVLGLGDSSYPLFCGMAQSIDARLAELGAQRLQEVGTADLDIDTVALPWQDRALEHAQKTLKQGEAATATVTALRPKPAKVSRDQPYLAELLLNQPITGHDSAKDVRHLEISLEGSSLSYQPGDALGVWPTQSAALVEAVAATLGLDLEEVVEVNEVRRPLREWLARHRELTLLTKPFLLAHAQRADDAALQKRIGAPETLRPLLEGYQLLDLLKEYPAAWEATALVQALRPLAPRMYSIASSQAAVGAEVHLTLAHVNYEREEQARWGCASHFLSDLDEGHALPVFIEENPRFRLPADPARDIIMIGPGTGIAPFRAFVQERSATGASGRNWLFFGNPHFTSDFLYQTEWQRALKEGELHRLDLAFSRDQSEKVYVQDKLLAAAAEVYDWLQGGAHLYVCGDATRMAKDVHQALLQVAQAQGGLEPEAARQWLDGLAAQGRYARDVY